jgi:hypothetical protein
MKSAGKVALKGVTSVDQRLELRVRQDLAFENGDGKVRRIMRLRAIDPIAIDSTKAVGCCAASSITMRLGR